MTEIDDEQTNTFSQSFGQNIYQNVLAIQDRVSRTPVIAKQIENIAFSILKDTEMLVYHAAEHGFNEAIIAIFNSQSRIAGIRIWEYIDHDRADIGAYLKSNPGIIDVLQERLAPLKVSLDYHAFQDKAKVHGIIRVSW
jgi:hypothetical protein